MGAGNGQHPPVFQYVLADPLWAGHVRQAAVQDFLHQRIAARYHIANYKQIRVQLDLLGVKPLNQLDALGCQLGAHWWVNVGVAAGDGVAGFLGQYSQAAHEGAANAEDMDMHDEGVNECRKKGILPDRVSFGL